MGLELLLRGVQPAAVVMCCITRGIMVCWAAQLPDRIGLLPASSAAAPPACLISRSAWSLQSGPRPHLPLTRKPP